MYTGPTLSLSWISGPGTPIDSTPRPMNLNIDPDTTPDTYIEHRELVRIGDAGHVRRRRADPHPHRLELGRDDRGRREHWLGGGLPPMSNRFIRDFTTRYMDPTEVYGRFDALAAEFPNISQLIPLPNRTNGYQRRAQATMSGTRDPGAAPEHRPPGPAGGVARGRAHVTRVGPRGRQRPHCRVHPSGPRRTRRCRCT